MKRILIVAVFAISTAVSFAQDKSTFPNDFIGQWKGTLEWYRTGNSKPEKVNMELTILPSKDSAGQYSWHMVYGSASQDNRPYLLKPVDTAKGHWVIDELNGIVLHQYWVGNRFICSFTVLDNTITNTYYLENGNLIAEFIANPAKAVSTSGKGTEDSPTVDSYVIRGFQRAVLKK